MKKVNNFRKYWSEHYSIQELGYHTIKGKVYTIEVSIRHHNHSMVHFDDEWDRIKKLALRQQFYPIPLHKDNGNGTGIQLIRRDAFSGSSTRLLEVYELVKQQYWTVQGDVNCTDILYELKGLSTAVKTILMGFEDMKSHLQPALRKELFDNFAVLHMVIDYQLRLSSLLSKVQVEERVDREIHEKIQAIHAVCPY